MRPLHVAITSGPTREPIDDVRYVSNVSTGRLGSAVATAFCRAGHRVTLLHGASSIVPAAAPTGPALVEFSSAQSLLDALARLFGGADAPALLIHAAAVADYAPVRVAGKVASTNAELVVRMLPTPKIADAFRAAFRAVPLVVFKLESNVARAELHARALTTLRRVGAQAVVANLLEDVGPAAHRAELLRADGTVVAFADRDALAAGLVAEAESLVRSSSRAAGAPS